MRYRRCLQRPAPTVAPRQDVAPRSVAAVSRAPARRAPALTGGGGAPCVLCLGRRRGETRHKTPNDDARRVRRDARAAAAALRGARGAARAARAPRGEPPRSFAKRGGAEGSRRPTFSSVSLQSRHFGTTKNDQERPRIAVPASLRELRASWGACVAFVHQRTASTAAVDVAVDASDVAHDVGLR